MKQIVYTLKPLLLFGLLLAAPLAAAQHKSPASDPKRGKPPETIESDTPPFSKVVGYSERDVVKIKAKVRFSTLIVLPKNEQILDFTCGDKEFWIINGTQNFAQVKPAKPGSQTNLNLITASGNTYSFLLSEVSELPGAEPDLKVFVEPKDDSMISAANDPPKLFSAKQVQDYRDQIDIANDKVHRTIADEEATVHSEVSKFIAHVRFPYRFEAGKKPFYVRAMYNDDKFTYIQARPEETPTLYEIKDGKPNLVNFEYVNGAYQVDKILDRGYLVIGKQKLAFTREE